MSINLWKLSTFVCGGLLVAAVGWTSIPTASADQAEAPQQMDSCEDQGHMEAALEHLRVARHELHLADHNKADHRIQAMARTQEAINQVKKGCRFADDRRDNE